MHRLLSMFMISLCLISIPVFAQQTEADTAVGSERLRNDIAVFDESIEWATSRAATDRILDELVKIGAGIYVPIVWHGKGAYYPSRVAHVDARLSGRIAIGERDPLSYLIAKARAKGIQVHPWFTVIKREDDRMPRYFEQGTPTGAFELHNPNFRKFIVDLIVDVAERYPVDGINLDYIRSMGLCRSRTCIESYRRHTGESLEVDLNRRFMPHIRERIGKWNQAAIREILTKLRTRLPAKTSLSVDAHPLERITEEQGQYSIEWANSRLIDRVYDMRYAPTLDFNKLNDIRAGLNRKTDLWILISNANKVDRNWETRDVDVFIGQIDALRKWQPGIGIGIWHRPRLSPDQSDALAAMKNRE